MVISLCHEYRERWCGVSGFEPLLQPLRLGTLANGDGESTFPSDMREANDDGDMRNEERGEVDDLKSSTKERRSVCKKGRLTYLREVRPIKFWANAQHRGATVSLTGYVS